MVLVWELLIILTWLLGYPAATIIDVQLYEHKITRYLVAGAAFGPPPTKREVWKGFLYQNALECGMFSTGMIVGLVLSLPA